MDYRKKIRSAIFLAILACVILMACLSRRERSLINILSIIGVVLSVLGIWIAYFQILSIKAITLATQKEVKESISQNNKIHMLADLSRKVAIIDEIQGFLKSDRIDMCILRMKDLKIVLNSHRNLEVYYNLFSKLEFKTAFEDFNIDLDNFQKSTLNEKFKLNKGKILINLEALSTMLLTAETKLKSYDYDA